MRNILGFASLVVLAMALTGCDVGMGGGIGCTGTYGTLCQGPAFQPGGVEFSVMTDDPAINHTSLTVTFKDVGPSNEDLVESIELYGYQIFQAHSPLAPPDGVVEVEATFWSTPTTDFPAFCPDSTQGQLSILYNGSSEVDFTMSSPGDRCIARARFNNTLD